MLDQRGIKYYDYQDDDYGALCHAGYVALKGWTCLEKIFMNMVNKIKSLLKILQLTLWIAISSRDDIPLSSG